MKIIDFIKKIKLKPFGKSEKGGTVVAKPEPPIKPPPPKPWPKDEEK